MATSAHATASPIAVRTSRDLPRPEIEPEPRPAFERALVAVFVAVPLIALVAAVPLAWGWGLGWHDVIIAVAFYYIAGLGISVGLHRYFTHGSFKAVRGLKIALAVPGAWPSRGQ
jgi:stearoyl-CoA desaturase (Delta-9 desaturase)